MDSSEQRTSEDAVNSPLKDMSGISTALPPPAIPPLFTTLPPLCDFDPTNLSPSSRLSYQFSASFLSSVTRKSATTEIGVHSQLKTETVRAQNQTVARCLPFLTGTKDGLAPSFNAHGVSPLEWSMHADFVRDELERKPPGFVGFDAARPWIVYWSTTALALLYELSPRKPQENEWEYGVRQRDNRAIRNRALDTFYSQQNAGGGFGGSHGHFSHVAPSYAAVLSLATLATLPDGKDTLSMVDRHGMWRWLGSLKQASGGIAVCEGGEIDVRAAYIALTIISLLNLPLELPDDAPARRYGFTKMTDGLGEWLGRCQTYEGGISAAPNNEAHGAYAFCVLAALSLMGDLRETVPRYIDVEALTAWLAARQYAPEGGFSGRTNKLVDACYSHWVGGCWPLLEAVVCSDGTKTFKQTPQNSLYNREGLIRYILCCCQAENGGLRDKPGKYPDAYHCCYALAGLSSAQHYSSYEYPDDVEGFSLGAAFGWQNVNETTADQNGDDAVDGHVVDARDDLVSDDVVLPIHPVFVIPFEAVSLAKEKFRGSTWQW